MNQAFALFSNLPKRKAGFFLLVGLGSVCFLCTGGNLAKENIMKMPQLIIVASAAALVAGCTSMRQQMGYAKAVSLTELPPAAQATVRNEVGDRPIYRITEETKYGHKTYRVEVAQPWFNSTLWVKGDGAIVKESSRLVQQREKPLTEAAGSQTPASSKSGSSAPAKSGENQ